MAASTQAWEAWVKHEIRARLRAEREAVDGPARLPTWLAPVATKHRAALDELCAEVAVLRNEFAEYRAEAKVRGALDDVQARLAKLETPPRLKAMG